MTYETPDPLHPTLLPALIAAEDSLARLDERAGRHPVSEGFRERGQFFDAAAALWVAGELVHVEASCCTMHIWMRAHPPMS